MAEVVISPLAKADMREIADYISREKHSPIAAASGIPCIIPVSDEVSVLMSVCAST